MRIPFIKMHGLGNDFVVLDGRTNDLPAMTAKAALALADRREGVGCDQVIMLGPSDAADFRMQIFNSDGSEVEACGNASRAVAVLHGSPSKVETAGGIIALTPTDAGASVDMGKPRFEWDDIPLGYAMDASAMPMAWSEGAGSLEAPFAVNVGNPHAVFVVEDADIVDLAAIGPVIENDPVFPQRVNVNVLSLAGPDHIKLHVWERGAGLTRACGTGACASAVAAISKGLVQSPVIVTLPGGDLEIAWERGGSITMTGPATEAFRGELNWEDYA
ncbi:MAG: diaminopimelate epimerase [Pseudomonadota bacterium]